MIALDSKHGVIQITNDHPLLRYFNYDLASAKGS